MFWYKLFRAVFSVAFLLWGIVIKVDICYVNNVKNKLKHFILWRFQTHYQDFSVVLQATSQSCVRWLWSIFPGVGTVVGGIVGGLGAGIGASLGVKKVFSLFK